MTHPMRLRDLRPLIRSSALALVTVLALLSSVVLLALAAAPAWAASEGLRVSHAQGELVIASAPKRIVVFDLASLDTLQALGATEVVGVPKTALPTYLAAYAQAPHVPVGTLFEPDYAAVQAARPDLIVIAGRSSQKYAELARIAPTIDLTVDAKAFYPGVLRNVRTLGGLVGRSAQAEALVADIETRVAALRQQSASAGRGLTVLASGTRASAFGPGSRFGMIHDVFGVEPAAKQLKSDGNRGQAVTPDFLLETDPDWLFVLDRDTAVTREGAAPGELLKDPRLAGMTAVRKGQVVQLDGVNWYLLSSAGATSLRQSVDQIASAFSQRTR